MSAANTTLLDVNATATGPDRALFSRLVNSLSGAPATTPSSAGPRAVPTSPTSSTPFAPTSMDEEVTAASHPGRNPDTSSVTGIATPSTYNCNPSLRTNATVVPRLDRAESGSGARTKKLLVVRLP